MYYSFSSVTFMRFFARGLCIHSYVGIKELIHNPRLPILFRPPPPPPPPGCDMLFHLWDSKNVQILKIDI